MTDQNPTARRDQLAHTAMPAGLYHQEKIAWRHNIQLVQN